MPHRKIYKNVRNHFKGFVQSQSHHQIDEARDQPLHANRTPYREGRRTSKLPGFAKGMAATKPREMLPREIKTDTKRKEKAKEAIFAGPKNEKRAEASLPGTGRKENGRARLRFTDEEQKRS
jgi:hypothetical protein